MSQPRSEFDVAVPPFFASTKPEAVRLHTSRSAWRHSTIPPSPRSEPPFSKQMMDHETPDEATVVMASEEKKNEDVMPSAATFEQAEEDTPQPLSIVTCASEGTVYQTPPQEPDEGDDDDDDEKWISSTAAANETPRTYAESPVHSEEDDDEDDMVDPFLVRRSPALPDVLEKDFGPFPWRRKRRHSPRKIFPLRACCSLDETDLVVALDDDPLYTYPQEGEAAAEDDDAWTAPSSASRLDGAHSWDAAAAFRTTTFRKRPTQPSNHNNTGYVPTLPLQQRRMEIERDDAIDILACLVERGVSSSEPVDAAEPPDMTRVVQELQELSLAEERLGDFDPPEQNVAHQQRTRALAELVRSHAYAVEMKRATQSAAAWLQSIGRSSRHSSSHRTEPAMPPSESPQRRIPAEEWSEDPARLQRELEEKTDLAARLNEELAQCRAEIGRLNSAAQNNTIFRSPNRSILDESDDAAEEDEADDRPLLGDTSRILEESDCLNASFLREEGESDTKEELLQYKVALDQANATIRQLHSTLQKYSEKDLVDDTAPPLVDVPPPMVLPKDTRPSELDTAMATTVAAGMPPGVENFVTDWDVLTLPSYSPPDHDVRSPIVDAVLDLWTDDRSLQESLRNWMDQVLEGADPESIPPLTVNHLDHRARDAFCLHIFPLLLRRPDILLDMKTRVHHRTTYDLSVSLDRTVHPTPPPPPYISHSQRQFETTSIRSDVGSYGTDSTVTTALISNAALATLHAMRNEDDHSRKNVPPMSRLSYDEMTEDMISASSSDTPGGFMSTIGGALGELLGTRRRPDPLPHGSMATIVESPQGLSPPHFSPFVEVDQDLDQPYHRVVSAPPGRIGVTFVEYRGHCMVSDVYPDSPLIGWIFPSDILIAIDETPVSGRRIRDIIAMLKDRVGAPRALRVISGYSAMNECTALNASAVVNDETGS